MGKVDAASKGSPEPVPVIWRARRRAMRGMPQAGCHWAVPGPFDAMRFVPLTGLEEHHEPTARQRWYGVCVGKLSGVPFV
jgi:hypothetical protein